MKKGCDNRKTKKIKTRIIANRNKNKHRTTAKNVNQTGGDWPLGSWDIKSAIKDAIEKRRAKLKLKTDLLKFKISNRFQNAKSKVNDAKSKALGFSLGKLNFFNKNEPSQNANKSANANTSANPNASASANANKKQFGGIKHKHNRKIKRNYTKKINRKFNKNNRKTKSH